MVTATEPSIVTPAKLKESLQHTIKEHLIEARQLNIFLKGLLSIYGRLLIISLCIIFGMGMSITYLSSQMAKYKAEATLYKERVQQLQLESLEYKKEVAQLELELKPVREMVRKSSLYAQSLYGLDKEQADLYADTIMKRSLEKRVPYLVAFSVAIEESSLRYNVVSPNGCCTGLMGVSYYWHHEKLKFKKSDLYDPVKNIDYGTSILKDYIADAGGVRAGLLMYYGHPTNPKINEEYADRVLRNAVALKYALRRIT